MSVMGDMGDLYRDLKEYRRSIRAGFGIPCPQCRVKQPKREPTIMLPGQRCKVDGYRDPRPRLTDGQINAALNKETQS
jgi:hypothetical protein